MDLDYANDLQEDVENETLTHHSDPAEEGEGSQVGDDESMGNSNDGMDNDSPAALRSMRSSRSPEMPAAEDAEPDSLGDTAERSLLQAGTDSCPYYDMTPTIAAPQATHINCLVTTRNLRWYFTGGQDGYIRKHDFHQTITGKVPLTVAQKHPFVDTVQKSGVLLSYWENEEDDSDATNLTANGQQAEKALSPVYCLAVQRDALWMLSGLYTGGINLQSVRVEEGKIVSTMTAHKGPVSVLQLMRDERSLLSGGWDKQIYDWDLETGKTRRNFVAGNKITGQVSSIALRPENASALDMSNARPLTAEPAQLQEPKVEVGIDPPAASPASSNSFDPLFDEDDEPTPALPQTINPAALEAETAPNGQTQSDNVEGPEEVFLSACIDGTMSIWDRRQSTAIARIPLPPNVPPWCMSACWSLDGDSFYCGRRNQTVEEYSMRANMTLPIRTIKLPNNSGPVTSVTAMPNNRSLICASADNVRMYDLKATNSGMPFLIIPGHHGGVISQFWVDRTCRYAFSTSGNRGWDGLSTEVLIGYEIKPATARR